MARALILDCDGVLANTERDGHLVAFNHMFDELDLPFHWTESEYAELVKIGGGKERLASVLSPEVARELGITDPAAAVASWHRRKTDIYLELLRDGTITARPGVRRLVEEALEAGLRIAVASTSAELSVLSVLRHAIEPSLARHVRVFAGDIVPHKKPAPDIYAYALRALFVPSHEAVIIEDSGIGCKAACGVGVPPIITPSSYTGDDDFTGAALVVSDLGELDSPATLLSNPRNLPFRGIVDIPLVTAIASCMQ